VELKFAESVRRFRDSLKEKNFWRV
jgi:hypothetical protein